MDDRSHNRFPTGTSIESGGVTLALWTLAKTLSKMMEVIHVLSRYEQNINPLLLPYSSALHQHTDDNMPGTDVTMPHVCGI
jgi:hypothetical protein